VFHFKQFSVSHSQCTMKVGTDAVLLGAWMPVHDNCKTILDIGCGCGVIALMLAQKTSAKVTGIDMDKKSVIEAQKNAENSPWKNRMLFIHDNLQHFVQKNFQKFDVIVSNPPFFENSLKSPLLIKNISKHNNHLSYEELVKSVDILLSNAGRFGLILPVDSAGKFEKLMLKVHLFTTKKTWIHPTSAKNANRVLMMFEREQSVGKEDILSIRDQGYTKNYYELMKEYLII